MTTHDTLVRAVLENPGEDTPRLAFADWLDEFGGPKGKARAELIRVQCEVNRTSPVAHDYACDMDYPGAHKTCPGCAVRARKDTLDRRTVQILRKWGMGWLPSHARGNPRQRLFEVLTPPASGCSATTVRSCVDGVFASFAIGRGWVESVRIILNEWRFDPRNIVDFARQVLAANPCHTFTVSVEGQEPEVELMTLPVAGGGWRALLYQKREHRELGPWVDMPTRARMCAHLADWLFVELQSVVLSPSPIPF